MDLLVQANLSYGPIHPAPLNLTTNKQTCLLLRVGVSTIASMSIQEYFRDQPWSPVLLTVLPNKTQYHMHVPLSLECISQASSLQ